MQVKVGRILPTRFYQNQLASNSVAGAGVLVSTLKLIVSGGFSISETSFPSQGKIIFSHGVFLSLRKVFSEILLLIHELRGTEAFRRGG